MIGQMSIYDYVPKVKASCHTCSYYRMTCDAYTCEPTGIKTCSKFEAWSQNKNLDPENGCELWEDTK